MSLPSEKPSNALESGQSAYVLLQALTRTSRQETDIRKLVSEFARVVSQLLPAQGLQFWQGAEVDRLVEIEPSERVPTLRPANTPGRELLDSALVQRTARMSSSASATSEAVENAPMISWMLVPIVGAQKVYGIVFCELLTVVGADVLANYCGRLHLAAEATLPFFEAENVRALLVDRDWDRRFEDFCGELNTEPSMSTTPSSIAVEYQRLFQSDRAWLLTPAGSGFRVRAVGGIPGFQRRAEVVRRLQTLVQLVSRTRQPFHWTAGDSTNHFSPRVRTALDQYLDESHVGSLRIEPLLRPVSRQLAEFEHLRLPVIGVVICEWFQSVPHLVPESRWAAARRQAALALQNATDWARAPIARLFRTVRRTQSWGRLTGWTLGVAAISIVLGFAAMIPVEFTIDAKGELQSVNRRHVFATTAGIVRNVAVNSGMQVEEGATLLELDSPELELEIRRTEGNLQTTEKRIKAVEASRLDFSFNSSDSASQLNSLASDLKELKQEQINLVHELELLNARRNDLKVVSPINGRVVTWDLERTLLRRPVVQGQRLLTISDGEGAWELELKVLDEDTSDLYSAIKANPKVAIDFVAIAQPEHVYSTILKSVAETIEIQPAGNGASLLCLADVPDHLVDSAVEGMSVRGRIHCGRRPAYHFVFDKLWRVIREQILFPLGW